MTVQSLVRLGLIGAGHRGRAIIEAMGRTTSACLVRVSSRNPETREQVTSNCQIFPDWRTMLDPTALDGLIIAAPSDTHFTIARDALVAGLPVLIETPLAMTIADAIALKQQAMPPLVMVNHTPLAHPAYRFMKELVVGNTVGPIRGIRSYFGAYRPGEPVLWRWGAQDLALCVDLLNTSEPEELLVRRIRHKTMPEGRGETVELRFDFAKDTDVRLRLSNILEQGMHYFAIHFDQLTLVYDGSSPGTLTLYPPVADFSVPNDEGQLVALPPEDPLSNTLSWFAMAIANRVDDSESLDLGVDVVALLARCQAFLEGKTDDRLIVPSSAPGA